MASRGVNKVILVGNLGQDPVISQSSNGSVVANVSIATSVVWMDKQTGQKMKEQSGAVLYFFKSWPKLFSNNLKKAQKSMLKVRYAQKNGRIILVRISTPLRSLLMKCRC